MPYATPSVVAFKARFPTFPSVLDEIVTSAIAEAETHVDETWIDEQRTLGVMLYAAHVLTIDGRGSGAEAEMAKAGALGFKSMRSGALTLDRKDDPAATGAGSTLKDTTFGRRFIDLRRANCPAVAVA